MLNTKRDVQEQALLDDLQRHPEGVPIGRQHFGRGHPVWVAAELQWQGLVRIVPDDVGYCYAVLVDNACGGGDEQ